MSSSSCYAYATIPSLPKSHKRSSFPFQTARNTNIEPRRPLRLESPILLVRPCPGRNGRQWPPGTAAQRARESRTVNGLRNPAPAWRPALVGLGLREPLAGEVALARMRAARPHTRPAVPLAARQTDWQALRTVGRVRQRIIAGRIQSRRRS